MAKAAILVKFLLEPAPLEHLSFGNDGSNHHKKRTKTLIAKVGKYCTELERHTDQPQDSLEVQMPVNHVLQDELCEREHFPRVTWHSDLLISD